MNTIIEVTDLRKTYQNTVAIDGVSFNVEEGEIFGMVGPNGAGKTTTIECIEGLRKPDGGSIRVLDLDPTRQERQLRPLIGIQLQEANLPDHLKVWEALDLYASFYPRTLNWQELIEVLGLSDKRKTAFGKLSGGQKQRLFIALALLNDPQLIFLDELTTGLDPQARHAIWELIDGIRNRGKTVFLTTHFMEEAEHLCDRVAIMVDGKIVALDSPANLIDSLDIEERVAFKVAGSCSLEVLSKLPRVTRIETLQDEIIIYGKANGSNNHAPLVTDIVNTLAAEGVRFLDLRTEQPNLEDVFLTLTGRKLRN